MFHEAYSTTDLDRDGVIVPTVPKEATIINIGDNLAVVVVVA